MSPCSDSIPPMRGLHAPLRNLCRPREFDPRVPPTGHPWSHLRTRSAHTTRTTCDTSRARTYTHHCETLSPKQVQFTRFTRQSPGFTFAPARHTHLAPLARNHEPEHSRPLPPRTTARYPSYAPLRGYQTTSSHAPLRTHAPLRDIHPTSYAPLRDIEPHESTTGSPYV